MSVDENLQQPLLSRDRHASRSQGGADTSGKAALATGVEAEEGEVAVEGYSGEKDEHVPLHQQSESNVRDVRGGAAVLPSGAPARNATAPTPSEGDPAQPPSDPQANTSAAAGRALVNKVYEVNLHLLPDSGTRGWVLVFFLFE